MKIKSIVLLTIFTILTFNCLAQTKSVSINNSGVVVNNTEITFPLGVTFSTPFDLITATDVVVDNIKYETNGMTSVATVDMAIKYAGTNYADNFTITGLLNIDPEEKYVQSVIRFYTNSSGSYKTVTLPANWIGVSTTEYITNQSMLEIIVYPKFGTNVIWRTLE